MLNDIQSTLNKLLETLDRPFWQHGDFWIFLFLGVAGLFFSILAFTEAKQAKQAATEAGRTVKVQTVTIELTEVAQKLDKIQPEIRFNEARDLFNDTSRRLRRVMSQFSKEPELGVAIEALRQALGIAQNSLRSVRPTDPAKEGDAPNAVYYAIEDDFATINNCVADLLGLFEKQANDFGEENVEF